MDELDMRVEQVRKFMPVGHGAFFIERLFVEGQRVLTVVYDCGDSDAGRKVELNAKQEFGLPGDESWESIDVLFISHFDDDHINGLQYLQPYLKHTARVFMPFYYAHLQNVYDRNKRTGIATIFSILAPLNIKPVLVGYSGTERQGGEIDIDEYDFERVNHSINGGLPIVKIVNGHPIWRYVPFNLFNERLHYQHFSNKVKNDLHWNDAKLQDAAHWTDHDIKDLRRIYNSFAGTTINDNSLIVLSDKMVGCCGHYHTGQSECFKQLDYCPDLRCLNHCCISCLYTGDTVLKRGVRKMSKYVDRYETLIKNLEQYIGRLSLMQIPHHGSGNNSNIASLCDCISLRLFCNYDTKDLRTTITMLSLSRLESVMKTIYSITEDAKSVFEEKFHYWV